MTNINSCKCGHKTPFCFHVDKLIFPEKKFKVTCFSCYLNGGIHSTEEKSILDWNINHTNGVVTNEYMSQNQKKILSLAVSTFGKEKQINKAIEEACELGGVLAKRACDFNPSTNEQIIDEIVDMQIMLEQLKMIFDDGELFDRFFQKKLFRLNVRLNNILLDKDNG